MQEFVPACEAAGLEPRIANLENPGCIAWIRGSGPGAIVFRPNCPAASVSASALRALSPPSRM